MKCFADNDFYCSALKINQLKPSDCEGCNFFKTAEQIEKDKEKTMKRIDSLDKTTKVSIYERYFK